MTLHPIQPVYDRNASILILGSFPSVKSREIGFFYGHPQNRFWRVVSAVWQQELPQTTEEKRSFLLKNHIALWDVIQSCEIDGSSDSSIRQVTPNDLSPILRTCRIRQIYTNGKKANCLYQRYLQTQTHRNAVYLPSTSPANASWSLERLIEAWSVIRQAE